MSLQRMVTAVLTWGCKHEPILQTSDPEHPRWRCVHCVRTWDAPGLAPSYAYHYTQPRKSSVLRGKRR